MEGLTFLSVIPPIIAISLAILTRQVFISLFIGIWSGWLIISGGNPLSGLRDALASCINVFADAGNTRVIIFSAMVGSLIAFTNRSGGVQGFIRLVSKTPFLDDARGVRLMSCLTGCLIFVESSITSLVTGSIFRPLFDKHGISREKLAYICDSTSAPVCMLIPLNGWGALIIGLLSAQSIDKPVSVLLSSIPFNLYSIVALIMVFIFAYTGMDLGPMKKAEARVKSSGKLMDNGAEPMISDEITSIEPVDKNKTNPWNLVIPIGVMVSMMPVGLLITGNGNLMQGSGSTSVFWAVLAAILCGGVMYKAQGLMNLRQLMDLFFKGMAGLLPLAVLMVLAFAIGATCKELKTGLYVSSIARGAVNPGLIPFILFVTACFIAFSTGTSWGTFAIMLPIGIPMAQTMDLNLPLVLGAMLSGGIFGDHCSPISDTTIISSMASATDHIDHVRTQLPYALLSAAMAGGLYIILGFVL